MAMHTHAESERAIIIAVLVRRVKEVKYTHRIWANNCFVLFSFRRRRRRLLLLLYIFTLIVSFSRLNCVCRIFLSLSIELCEISFFCWCACIYFYLHHTLTLYARSLQIRWNTTISCMLFGLSSCFVCVCVLSISAVLQYQYLFWLFTHSELVYVLYIYSDLLEAGEQAVGRVSVYIYL